MFWKLSFSIFETAAVVLIQAESRIHFHSVLPYFVPGKQRPKSLQFFQVLFQESRDQNRSSSFRFGSRKADFRLCKLWNDKLFALSSLKLLFYFSAILQEKPEHLIGRIRWLPALLGKLSDDEDDQLTQGKLFEKLDGADA